MAKTRRRKEPAEHTVLRDDGFDLYLGEKLKGGVKWDQIDKVAVFKEDLVTLDLICMEFTIGARNEMFEINEDVQGFWDVVKQIKVLFPSSRQDWEASVVKPAFERNATIIYERD